MPSDTHAPTSPAEDAPDGDGFHRLHPTCLVVGIARHARVLLLPALLVLLLARPGGWDYWIAILFVPSALYELYNYATFRYRLTGDEIIIKRGLIFRSERHVPLARVQNIDLVQTPLHRAFHVAKVRVETAGGSEPEAEFPVLSLAAVERLRGRVVAGRTPAAPGATEPGAGDVPGALLERSSARVVHRIPAIDLIKMGLLSNRGLAMILVALGVAWEFRVFSRLKIGEFLKRHAADAFDPLAPLIGAAFVLAIFVLVRLLSAAWMLVRFHGYTLTSDGNDLRLTCGLLTRLTATIPRRRVQLVSVQQSLAQRWLGRTTVRVETAGGISENDQEKEAGISRRWFIPTVPAARLPEILREIRPALDTEFAAAAWQPLAPRARRRMTKGMLIVALLFTGVATLIIRPWGAAVALLLIPLGVWHARRAAAFLSYAPSPGGLLFRSGAWTRRISATFFDKVQVAWLEESPFDRRHRMATLCVDTAGAGPAGHKIRVPYLPKAAAMGALTDVLSRTEHAVYRW